MPIIPLGSQPFDLAFHPSAPLVYTANLDGTLTTINYPTQSTLKLSKRPIRCISAADGHVYAAGKAKAIYSIDTTTAKLQHTTKNAHDASINRIKWLTNSLLASGDDNGLVKLWDPRQSHAIRSYDHHFDYITDFLWLQHANQLVTSSGDATLSVIDVRKSTPLAHSEDQEDELLSLVSIRGATKVLVGTLSGILSVFDPKKGWADCVDRIPGHPQSIDALCPFPPSFPHIDSSSAVLTGSSDGMVRAVQVFPTNMLAVAADHGDWPIERIAVGEAPADDLDDNGRWWMGSIGHDEYLKLTPLESVFAKEEQVEPEEDSDEEETKGKRKRKEKGVPVTKKHKSKKHVDVDDSHFFDGI